MKNIFSILSILSILLTSACENKKQLSVSKVAVCGKGSSCCPSKMPNRFGQGLVVLDPSKKLTESKSKLH